MSNLLVHIADRVLNRPLMVTPEKLAMIAQVLEGRIGIDASEFAAIEAEALRNGPDASRFVGQFDLANPGDPKSVKPYRTTDKGVALIHVFGSLVNRGAWIGARSGMTSYEGLKYQLAAAAADRDVTSILLDIDSPGGEAVGAFEVADAVRAASKSKDVVAVVNGMAASAAYAIASGAPTIITTASGISGSIGVVLMHADYSHALHDKGITPTLIHAGARKVDGSPYKPLTDDVRAELKAEVDSFYDLFVGSVAQGRKGKMTDASIRATEARTYIGAGAVKVGLADAIGSFETVLADLSTKAPRFRPSSPAKRSTSGLAMESNPTVSAVPSAIESEKGLGAGLAPGPEMAPAVLPIAALATTDELAAAIAALPKQLDPAAAISDGLDGAMTSLKGKSAIPLGAGWEDAVAIASGRKPFSSDPGYGWMSVLANINAEERGREPLLHGWGDVIASVNSAKPQADLSPSWSDTVAQINAGKLR